MIKLWRQFKRQFLTYSRSDRNAVIILAAILLLLVAANMVVPLFETNSQNDFSELEAEIEKWERSKIPETSDEKLRLFKFDPNHISKAEIDSLDLPGFVKQNIIKYKEAGGEFKNLEDFRKIYGITDSIFNAVKDFVLINEPVVEKETPGIEKTRTVPGKTFDPNLIGYDSLLLYGFSEYQAGNLVKYRDNGGEFKIPEDVIKIYGIDSSFYQQVLRYINIEPREEVTVYKPKEITKVELNSADTSDLMALPGIGPVYAARIIKYRDLLGGYYSSRQLLEVYNFPEETYNGITDYVFTDTVKLQKLRLNFLDYPELIRHPYFNKKQVNELLEYRDKHGAFKSPNDIKDLKSFDYEMFSRIRPYVTCR
ncbi:ComEA family DNA-binding protein [Maribellus mangrovi]|uniref:ComEA family DNA-binding protein n=1 Tax=Maribellus mangrovi TaxID=3133146 RepID=UPI0030ECE548